MDQLLREGLLLRNKIDNEAKRIIDDYVKQKENPQTGKVPLTKSVEVEECQCDDDFKVEEKFTEEQKKEMENYIAELDKQQQYLFKTNQNLWNKLPG